MFMESERTPQNRNTAFLNTLGHLDEGNPEELAGEYAGLKSRFPDMNVFGGCCGTDFAHVRQISSALQST